MRLTNGETEIVLAIMAGHTTAKEIAVATGLARISIYGYLHRIYAKADASNMTQVALMIAGALPCPGSLLPAQKAWRRKHYKLDEF